MKLAAIGTLALGGSILALLVFVAGLPLPWAISIGLLLLLLALGEGLYQNWKAAEKRAEASPGAMFYFREGAVIEHSRFHDNVVIDVGEPPGRSPSLSRGELKALTEKLAGTLTEFLA
ncbi:MAG TPA: hypothetical protein VGW30_05095 [Gaiellaceae bacterium]|nr:hypothetical protein [Gaiellaceae bacterium]